MPLVSQVVVLGAPYLGPAAQDAKLAMPGANLNRPSPSPVKPRLTWSVMFRTKAALSAAPFEVER